jgi:hypothetical protein
MSGVPLRRGRHALALMVVALLLPTVSRADVTKDACVDANTRAQSLRRAGQLAEARAQLAVCGDPRCPRIVREDCTQRIDELERAQPTIVFDAVDPSGGDVSGVRVAVDGHPLADKLEGAALAVDPGEHAFTFETPGQPPVTRSFIIKEGDKGRRERIVVGGATAPVGATDGRATPAPAQPPALERGMERGTRQKTVALVLGGVGVAGVAVGSVFGLVASSKWSRSKSECSVPTATSCTDRVQAVAEHDGAVTDAAVSTVGFIAGGALVAAGALFYFTAPKAETGVSSLRVMPSVGTTDGLMVSGSFE